MASRDREQLAASAAWFPLVGALVGGAVAAVFALALTVVPPLLAAVFAVGAGVTLTGAIHEDGLADTLDALGGGGSRAERLRILQDPTVGAFGALGLVMSSLALVAALVGLGAWEATGGLVAAHSMARAAAVATMATSPLARSEGLAAAHVSALRTIGVVAANAGGLAIGALAIGLLVVPAALLVAAVAAGAARVAIRAFGGVGGDVLGAIIVVGVLTVLVVVAAGAEGGASVTWWAP